MGRADLSGAVLDNRYRVIEPIAEGAMGVVYRAERVKLGRIVAIKVLHDQLPSELSSRKRFEIEATAMAKLEHPHCAAVLDVGVHDDKPYVVMDFVSGSNLKDVIAGGIVPVPRAVEIVRQVLSGLAHAHEHGIIHRDIKPANIVLSQKVGLGDHVKILDFGLARLTGADVSNLTTGIVVGTPSYMAPEQIRGQAIDQRTDLYACGVLLFELLTGTKPFVSPKDDPIEVCSMHLKFPIPRLADRQQGIEFGELEAVIVRALAKSPADRYANAEEFANALEEIAPRKRAMTPVAGVAIVNSLATPSGWAVPEDASPNAGVPVANSAAPSAPNVVGPRAATAPISGSAPNAFAPSAPNVVAPSAPNPAPGLFAPNVPSAPTVVSSSAPDLFSPNAPSAPIAAPNVPSAPIAAPIDLPSQPEARPSLPPGFDLSLAIPSPTTTETSPGEPFAAPPGGPARPSLPPGFDLSLVIPSPPEPPVAPPEPPSHNATFLGVPVVASGRGSQPIVRASSPQPVRAASPLPERAASQDDSKATVAFLGAAPSGPSPLEVRDARPVADEPPVERPAPQFSRKQLLRGGAVALGTVLLIAIIAFATRGGGSKPVSAPSDAAVARPKLAPADEQFERANEMIAAGKHDLALEQLLAARKVFPDDARLAYLAGKVYFLKYWTSAGLKQFRDALRLDPGFRTDPELIRIALKAFIIARDYPADVATFLRTDIGAPARSFLEETAATHPSQNVRSRAAAELKRMAGGDP